MHTKEYLLNNLDGLGPLDWDQAMKDFAISGFNPKQLKIAPRNNVMLSLAGGNAATRQPVEVMLADWSNKQRGVDDKARQLRALARSYIVLSNKEARLPSFSRWVSSLFPKNDTFNVLLSKAGNEVGSDNGIIMSCNPIDILRGADSKNFASCLGHDSAYAPVLTGVVTKCPGIAVAYIDGPTGKMQCRCWLNHARVNGEDVICIIRPYGNGFTTEALAEAIAAKGYDVYQAPARYGEKSTAVDFVDTFGDQGVHWDILEYAYDGAHKASLIAKAQPKIVKRAA